MRNNRRDLKNIKSPKTTVLKIPTPPWQEICKGAKEQSNTCPECGKHYANKNALQRHVREVHKRKREGAVTAGKYLTGVCVDFLKGLFIMSRSFSGVARPIHCQHSTYVAAFRAGITACEMNECDGAAVIAGLSGHPAFACIHLQSEQYAKPYQQPITLTETSLDDLVGQKVAWFKESKKGECLSLKDKAEEGGYPLIVPFPRDDHHTTSQRFWYFSVFDGGIHYWSRFGRVIVGVCWCKCNRAYSTRCNWGGGQNVRIKFL